MEFQESGGNSAMADMLLQGLASQSSAEVQQKLKEMQQ